MGTAARPRKFEQEGREPTGKRIMSPSSLFFSSVVCEERDHCDGRRSDDHRHECPGNH